MQRPDLYPFQRRGVDFYHKKKGIVLNADEQGLGKTIETLQFIDELDDVKTGIIVCPATLKTNWQQEAERFYGMSNTILSTTKPVIYKSYRNKDIVIINYDILRPWMTFLKSLKAPFLVMDEAQMISGVNARRTKCCTELSRGIPRRMCLSGTPILHRPWELYSLLNILRPDIWDSPWAFGMQYCEGEKEGTEWKFDGAENLGHLNTMLKKYVLLRRTKAQVLPDLPEKRRFVLPLDIDRRREYEHAEHDLIGWLATFDPIRAKRAEHHERFLKFGYLKRLAADLKMRAVFDWIDIFLSSTDRKLILGTIHRNQMPMTIPRLMERYGHLATTIHGGVSQANRDIAKHRFNNDPTCRIIVLQNIAGGVGINLQGSKRTVGIVEMPWAPGHIKQLIDRAHRIGTLDHVDVYFLVAHNTVESKLCQIIQRRQQISDRAIDGLDLTPDSLTIFDELTAMMLGEA